MPYNVTYFTRTGKVLTTVQNVSSQTEEDVLYYDGSYYRDTIDSATLGREINASGEVSVTITPPSGSVTGTGLTNPYTINRGGDTSRYGGQFDLTDPYFEQDDAYTHEPPRPLQKTRTRTVFWSGAAGSGDMLAWAWTDEILTLTTNQGTITRLI